MRRRHPEEVKKKIDKTDVLWDRGEKAEAAKEYRLIYQDSLPAEKEKILPRIVESFVKDGNHNEAKTWIKRGLDDNLKVEYKDAAAKELFAAAKKEHEASVANAAEEKRKNQEAAAKAKAEEDAKPKPTRANYNKITNGMTIAEVQAILGSGKEAASGEGILIATWQSDGFATTIISITFQNNRVTSKAIVSP